MKNAYSVLIRMAAILLLAAVCSLAANHWRRNPMPWNGEWSKHVEKRALQNGLKLAGIKSVREALASETAAVLDARHPADFRAGHIPGASSLPVELATDMLASMKIDLTPDQVIITYCARNDCDEGLELALLLRRLGFNSVTLFAGGLGDWRASGGAMEGEK